MQPAKPNLCFLGDSHTIVLANAAKKMGLATELIQLSGNFWAQGRFGYRRDGLRIGAATAAHKNRMNELGVTDLAELNIPVITTIGFHLGRLVPPFSWNMHGVDPMDQIETGLFASSSFVAEYIDQHRGRHFETLKALATRAQVIVVAPPIHKNAAYKTFYQLICAKIRARGVVVYDPLEFVFDHSECTPDDMFDVDGAHGCPEYGDRVMLDLIKRYGLISQ